MTALPEPAGDALLRMSEVKRRVGLGKTKIYAMIAEGKFPKPHRVTAAAVRWSARDIDRWVGEVTGSGSSGER